jgi:hypothetical protein
MKARMFTGREQSQIGRIIILDVAIFMMHNVSVWYRMPKHLLHNEAVFADATLTITPGMVGLENVNIAMTPYSAFLCPHVVTVCRPT